MNSNSSEGSFNHSTTIRLWCLGGEEFRKLVIFYNVILKLNHFTNLLLQAVFTPVNESHLFEEKLVSTESCLFIFDKRLTTFRNWHRQPFQTNTLHILMSMIMNIFSSNVPTVTQTCGLKLIWQHSPDLVVFGLLFDDGSNVPHLLPQVLWQGLQ